MSDWLPIPGECLLIDSGPIGKHLFVLVLNNKADKKIVALSVPVCTVRDASMVDDSCILQAGDHPFVKSESFIEYGNARVDDVHHILNCVKEKTFILHDPVSADLLSRIKDGLLKSKQVKRYIKDDFALKAE